MTENIAPYNAGPPPGPPRVGLCGGSCRILSLSPLLVLDRVGIPPGSPGHGTEFYEWGLKGCNGCAGAVLHRRVHDCYGQIEDVTDYWVLGPEDAARLRALISSGCPAPLEPACGCALHVALLASCRELDRPAWLGRVTLTDHPPAFAQESEQQ